MASIIIASTNPVKIQAALTAFQRMFPGETFEARGISVPSGVSVQPMTSAETLQGARNRASNAAREVPGADYAVGLEGGVEETPAGWESFSWIAVRSGEREGIARSGIFFLPPAIGELIRTGKELGEADDIVFVRTNSKQENGAIGILTDNAIDRAELYAHAVVLALVPFKNPGLYGKRVESRE